MSHALDHDTFPEYTVFELDDEREEERLDAAEDQASPAYLDFVDNMVAMTEAPTQRDAYLEALQEEEEQRVMRSRPQAKRRMSTAQFNA